MSLQQLLDISDSHQLSNQYVLTQARIDAQMDNVRHLISFFREYPDLFIDFIIKDDIKCNFKFYFYQRIFVRIVMRHRYVYATFPRA